MNLSGNLKFLVAAASTLLLLQSCGSFGDQPGDGESPKEPRSINLENMDTTVSPREDFYRFANGAYLDRTSIPDEEKRWGVFNELRDENVMRIRKLIEKAAESSHDKGTPEQQVGDYFAAATDSNALEKSGVSPLEPVLSKIEGIRNLDDLSTTLGWLNRRGISGGIGFHPGQDEENSSQVIGNLYPGGMPLPEKSYYTEKSPEKVETRMAYMVHIGDMLALSGMDESEAKAASEKILAMETDLAGHSLLPVEMRNPDNTYHKMALNEIESQVSNLNWTLYLDAVGAPKMDSVNLSIPGYFGNLNSVLVNYSIEDWKVYLRWLAIHSLSDDLNNAFSEENFNFFSKRLNGIPKMKPRYKRVIEGMNWGLGMPIGQLYVKEYFSESAKKRALGMVDNILGVMKERLAKLEWMSQATREQAIRKVDAILPKIGYPDKWRDYSGLTIVRDNHLANVLALREFNFQYRMDKIGKPVDRTEWGMPPQIVNAYYNPNKNEIVFPAGILQAPFFDEFYGEAENYGGFGAVIGHELIHAFDDSGARYDADGNKKDWWTPEDFANFKAKAQRVVEQYNGYYVNDSLHVNGELTLGENIADIDGLRMSFLAFQRAQEKGGEDKSAEKAGGYTPEQRFFINYGQIWANKARPDYLKVKLATDPHSPGNFRVQGTLSNRPEFYEAFGIEPGDPMYRPDSLRIVIW